MVEYCRCFSCPLVCRVIWVSHTLSIYLLKTMLFKVTCSPSCTLHFQAHYSTQKCLNLITKCSGPARFDHNHFLEEPATIDMDATTYMRRAATSICYSHMWDMACVNNVVYLSVNHVVSSLVGHVQSVYIKLTLRYSHLEV